MSGNRALGRGHDKQNPATDRTRRIETAIPYTPMLHPPLTSSAGMTRRVTRAMLRLFGINEYFRSWLNLYVDRWESFWGFILSRLAAYYVTAVNNGALMFEKLDPLYVPFYTAVWFWKFPIELVPGGLPELLNVDMASRDYWSLM